MTTIRQLVIDAFREGGLVQVGLTPEADEFDEGFRKMRSVVRSLYGYEMGEPLASVNHSSLQKSDNYYLAPNLRLMFNANSTNTIYLHPNPADGARFGVVDVSGSFEQYPLTVHANGKNIGGSDTTALEENNTNKEWFYRADLGEWKEVTNLTPDSESPFPEEFDDLLIIMLAMRISPRYQTTTAPESVQAYRRVRSQFRARYRQTRSVGVDAALTRIGRIYDFTSGGSYQPDVVNSWDTGEVIFDGGNANG